MNTCDEDIQTDVCIPTEKRPPNKKEKKKTVIMMVDWSGVNKTHALSEL